MKLRRSNIVEGLLVTVVGGLVLIVVTNLMFGRPDGDGGERGDRTEAGAAAAPTDKSNRTPAIVASTAPAERPSTQPYRSSPEKIAEHREPTAPSAAPSSSLPVDPTIGAARTGTTVSMQQISGEPSIAIVLTKAGMDATHHFVADLDVTPSADLALFVGPDGSNNRRLGGWKAFVGDVECYTPFVSEVPFARGEADLRKNPPPVIRAEATMPIHVVMTCYGGDAPAGADMRMSIRLQAWSDERVAVMTFVSPPMTNPAP